MKTIYYVASSLDGFIAGPNNALGWLLQFDAVPGGDYESFIGGVGALAMGSATYRWLLEHQGAGAPWPYSQPAWVFSSREQPRVASADVRFVSGDVRPAHAEMVAAAGGKDVWVVGGGELAGQFHDHGLLDELIVTYAPVTLGAGAPLLPRALTNPGLKLLGVRSYGDAMVQARYRLPGRGV